MVVDFLANSVLLLFVTCVDMIYIYSVCVLRGKRNTLEACQCCRVEEPSHTGSLSQWDAHCLGQGKLFSRKSKSTPNNANPARKLFKWFLLSLRLFLRLIAGNRQGPNGPIPRKTAWMVANDGCACTYRYGRTWEPWVLERILLQWQRLIGTMSVSILKKSNGICKSHSHWLD